MTFDLSAKFRNQIRIDQIANTARVKRIVLFHEYGKPVEQTLITLAVNHTRNQVNIFRLANAARDKRIDISKLQWILTDNARRLPVTADTIRVETFKDSTLGKIMHYVQTFWPKDKITTNLRPIFNRSGSLLVLENYFMLENRVVMLKRLNR